MCITKATLNLLNNNKPTKSKARGTWMSMLFSSFGTIYYDNDYTAYYRRHDTSVTSNKLKGIGLWKWRIKNFFTNNQFESYKLIITDFYNTCYNQLDDQNKKTLEIFMSNSRVKKVFYPKRLRSKIIDEIALRFIFLIGKL